MIKLLNYESKALNVKSAVPEDLILVRYYLFYVFNDVVNVFKYSKDLLFVDDLKLYLLVSETETF